MGAIIFLVFVEVHVPVISKSSGLPAQAAQVDKISGDIGSP